MNWFNLPQPETTWLIDGLIPSDGHVSITGKPKAGKSTAIRVLVAAIIKGQKFLGRSVDIPAGTGRVLYFHLDRKDPVWRVAKELRDLGINEQESKRLVIRTPQDIPSPSFADRLEWLTKEASAVKPHLIVIDLMWQFVVAKNSSDYTAVLDGINQLQDALIESKYAGALLVALHARKATNPNDPADDMLGSTGQRGSFATNILLARYRKQDIYTITTEQTVRDEIYGEIDETIMTRNADGTLSLGRPLAELTQEAKTNKLEGDIQRVLRHISEHPGCEIAAMVAALSMSKPHLLKVLNAAPALWTTKGDGVKGDPKRYYMADDPQAVASEVMNANWTQ